MKAFPQKTRIHSLYWMILLILLAACSGITTTAPVPPAQASPLSTAPGPAPTQEDMQGLSVKEAATLSSLKKVADYPLYTMHYSGAYSYPETGLNSFPPHGFACSLFAALGQPGDLLTGSLAQPCCFSRTRLMVMPRFQWST